MLGPEHTTLLIQGRQVQALGITPAFLHTVEAGKIESCFQCVGVVVAENPPPPRDDIEVNRFGFTELPLVPVATSPADSSSSASRDCQGRRAAFSSRRVFEQRGGIAVETETDVDIANRRLQPSLDLGLVAKSLSICRPPFDRISLAVSALPRASLGSETLKRPTRKSATCLASIRSRFAQSRSRAMRRACTARTAENATRMMARDDKAATATRWRRTNLPAR